MAELRFEQWENDGQIGVAVYVNGSRAFNLKHDGGHIIGIDFGQPFTPDDFRSIAEKLELTLFRLNSLPTGDPK